jgi:hypothetical protein
MTLPDLGGSPTDVSLLIDTGAVFSVVHPKDLARSGIDPYSALAGRDSVIGRGVGGGAQYVEEPARLTLVHSDGQVFDYVLPIHLALPTDHNLDYPSFLGMDFIRHFRLTVHFDAQLVELR